MGGIEVQTYDNLKWALFAHAQRTSNQHVPKGGGCPNYVNSLQNAEQNRHSVQVRMAYQPLKDLWVALAPGLPLVPLAQRQLADPLSKLVAKPLFTRFAPRLKGLKSHSEWSSDDEG